MKPKATQLEWVMQKLKEKGSVTRNEALENYISRLGSIICKLKKEYQINIIGEYYKTRKGRDYIYYVINNQ
jgi:hypothetical protein